MLKKYLEFLKAVFESITHKGGEITFHDYLSGIGMSIAIVAIIVLFIILLAGGWKFPFYLHKKFIADLKKKKEELVEALIAAENNPSREKGLLESLENDVTAIDKKISQRTKLFIVGVITLYLPIVIPTILYLTYLVFHI